MSERFNRERIRFHTKKENTLVIQGWFENDSEGEEQFEAGMGGIRLPLETLVQRGVEVTKKYLRYRTNVMTEYFLMITLPESRWETLHVYHVTENGQTCICRISGRKLKEISRHMESWVETLRELPDGRYQLRGWYMGCREADIALLGEKGRILNTVCTSGNRLDILGEFPEADLSETRGFELTFDKPGENYLRLALKGNRKKALYVINCSKMLSGKEGFVNLCRKSYRYLKRKGFRQFTKRVSDVVLGIDSISYERFRRKYGVTKQELAAQRETHFAYEPKISILVPLYRTPEKFLREMIASVEAQTYTNWELVLSDGSGEDSPLEKILTEYEEKDQRIRAVRNHRQLRIADNTNEAVRAATGEYLVFGDHDDLFAPDALYECVRVLNEKPDTELIYTDEDKTDAGGKRFFEPHFKPDYNPDLLCSMNYFCHLVLVKKTLQERVGLLDGAFDGAQDYDYVLRCCEQTGPEQIVHIPKILYHWRSHGESTAENPESKRYAFDAGRRAIQAHYDRMGIPAEAVDGEYAGIYHSRYEIQGEPLISILIPNKDHIADLRKCIRSVGEKSDYRNFEFIIIENNSTDPDTFSEYKKLEQEYENLRVVYYKGDFNFSDINNFGAQYARGEYFLLLNNDTEMIRSDCLRQLLGYCQRPDVGIVGALLYYEDDTIQHGGVVLGFGGIAGHAFIGEKRGDNGYFSRIICAQDYSAVTAACMMVKASVYREVGGMSTDLKVAFNDIDFCMKVRAAGYLVVYNPQAELYHYESKSRGLENTQEKIERFNSEMARFLDRWGDQVRDGDPYYNPNLTLDKANFSLKL
ncbi:MAG: glycosyltransferase family 2 protein [Candidatus Choladocola sp.]|nr:glycosyltransferase family 2 protein [Candidatus Choladocola sp.]